MDCEKSSNSSFCQECTSSFNLLYCFDCKNCHDCIGCSGLRNKGYYIFNQPYSKEDFKKEKDKIFAQGYSGFLSVADKFNKIKIKTPHRFAMTLQCKNVSGDHIVSSKNSYNCFDVKRVEDSQYSFRMIDARDSYDTNYCEYVELCYDYLGFWKVQRTKFSNTCGESSDLTYADFCSSSSYLFGCIGLRHKQYCILNKQYTKEEYERLVPKIIEHMNNKPYVSTRKNPSTDSTSSPQAGSGQVYKYGEFFPPELSPFCYNETIAQEYFPLTKTEALNQGYRWKDKEERNYQIDIKTKDIPNDIKDVNESIINKVVECEHHSNNDHPASCGASCTEAFKIIPAELQFYQRMNLPLPHLCPNCRHYQRLKQRNPLKLWHRSCMKKDCKNEFETSYAPDRPEIVYCEKCYQQEVY